MRRTLEPHPDTPCAFIDRLEVNVVREGAFLSLAYVVEGDIDHLRLPPAALPKRRDGLWQRTCFEAFLAPDQSESYCEFNLSSSSEWAAYAFDRYRQGMRALALASEPEVTVSVERGRLQLGTSLELAGVALLDADERWRASLTAVIVGESGDKSYWALAHPPGAPDFHHRDCFALELPAPERG